MPASPSRRRGALFAALFLLLGGSRVSAATCDTTLTIVQAGGGNCTGIQQCVDLVPTTMDGNYCLDIQDSATYNEAVVIRNKFHTAAGYRINIGPLSAQTPVVTPPNGATAAFRVITASVTLSGMQILVSNPTGFGVQITSDNVTLDRTLILDPGSNLGTYGVDIQSSYNTIQYSTISLAGAAGISVDWGYYNSISYTSITVNAQGVIFTAGAFPGGSNTFTNGYISGSQGVSISGGNQYSSDNNTVSFSTIIASSYGINIINNARKIGFGLFDHLYIGGTGGGINLDTNAVGSTISHSTVVTTNAGSYALHFNGASTNTISYSFIQHTAAYPFWMFGSGYNTIQFSTISAPAGGYVVAMHTSSFNILTDSYFTGAPFNLAATSFANTLQRSTISYSDFQNASVLLAGSSNTISQVLIDNPTGQSMDITGDGNIIIQSSMTGRTVSVGAPGQAILSVRGSSTTIISSFFQNNSQNGVLVLTSYNTISGSTIIAHGVGANPGYGALALSVGRNTVNDSWIYNREDNGNYGLIVNGTGNKIARSTITAQSSYGVYVVAAASNTIYGSYAEGKTAAAYISNATGTVINSSVLAAIDGTSDGLRLTAGSVNLTLSSTVIMGGAQAAGVFWAEGNSGNLTVSSVAIQGSIQGLHIDTQSVSTSFSLSSVTFQTMPAQSTAVYFGGGTFVMGLSNFNFLSNNILVNVDASRLGAGSSIGFSEAGGPKSGAGFELDPGNVVNWAALPLAPGTPVATALGISSVSWTWSAAPNATSYRIYLATDTVAQYGSVAGPPFVVTGQSTNTALGITVLGANSNGFGPLSPAATAYTLAAPTTAFAFAKVSLSSITVQWAANTNPAGTTTYRVDWWAGGSTTTVNTYLTSAAITGLSINTSYYLTVSAINGNGIVGAPSVVLATCTPTLPVAGTPSGTALGVSSISWTWSQAPNAASYRIYQASSPTTQVGTVAAPPFVYLNRSTNTAYGVVVAAVSIDGIGPLSAAATTYTLAAMPGSVSIVNVQISSFGVQWVSNGNPSGTTTYRVDWWGIVGATSSLTTSITSAAITGLNQGTSYYVTVSAISGDGHISSPTAVTPTLTQLSPFVTSLAGTALGVSSISWTWNAVAGATSYKIYLATEPTTQIGSVADSPFAETGLSTNTANGIVVAAVDGLGTGPLSPAATAYTLAAPATSFAAVQIYYTSITVQWAHNGNPASTTTYRVDRWTVSGATTSITVAITSASIVSLVPGTTYYMRVSPINGAGLISTSNVIISALTADLPVSGVPVGTALGVSSISWTWATPAGAASYNIYLATKPTSLVASVAAPPFIYLNRSTNTAYGIKVAAVDSNGIGPLSASATTYTLAAAPANIAIAQVTVTTIAVSWAAVGNPAGTTTYRVDRWAATGATTSVVVSLTSAVIGGLNQGTFYYFSVSALNAVGLEAPGGVVVSTRTLSLPVAGTPVGTALGVSSISWTWSAAVGASSYKVYLAADGVTLIGAVAAPPFVDTGLSTNTARAIVVSPIDSSGGIGILSASATIYTSASPPAAFSLVQVEKSSIAVQWSANTNPSGTTTYRVDWWSAAGATVSATTALTSATLSGLALDTTYYLRLTAFNGGGLATGFVEVSTLTRGFGQSFGGIDVGASSVAFMAPTGPIVVRIPPGAFTQPMTVILSYPASFPAPAPGPAALIGTGAGVQILLSQPAQPLTYVTLTVGYRDQDVAGLDASRLILARYDEDRRAWVPLVSVVDASTRTVTAQTNHFSTFQIMQAAAVEDIANIKAFPNPLRPALGHTLMTFAQLPANARLRIYDVRGSLVNELTADASGMVQWDGNNRAGAPAASGVYFVYAQGAGAKRTVKVAIQR